MAGWGLGSDIGGYAQGPMPSGSAGVPQLGTTYGDILAGLLKYGSKPGSSGPMFGSLIEQQTGAVGQQGQQQATLTGMQPPTTDLIQGKKSDQGLSELVQAAMAWFGIGG